jgi:hypothetical protein
MRRTPDIRWRVTKNTVTPGSTKDEGHGTHAHVPARAPVSFSA